MVFFAALLPFTLKMWAPASRWARGGGPGVRQIALALVVRSQDGQRGDDAGYHVGGSAGHRRHRRGKGGALASVTFAVP